jgi:muramidase (phage lysozyme)
MCKTARHIVIRLLAVAWLICAFAGPGLAGGGGDRLPMLRAAAAPLVALAAVPPAPRGSLFTDTREGGLFAALPKRGLPDRGTPDHPLRARLRDLIARAEAGPAGYNSVQGGAHRPPPRRPTRMTLRDIFDWIDATPGQPHAIGRYQIVPATLRRLVARAGLAPDAPFSPAVQDRLADMLLDDAGLAAVRRGKITRPAFLLNLAKVWAGLPTASGQSYYHGVAGNRAVLSYDSYLRAVTAILDG